MRGKMAELRLLRGGAEIILKFEPGARLSEVLKAGGIDFLQPCGGRGVCGKCAVVLK
ncbi:MAG: 2Fe-2S iron-sulfur cluster binding domain-containing protein, partial [Clostridia bacterium]|nr:2Fe-2S iron-sulfur cluster binding domain-containing protein [Clostridia bacterium]